MQRTVDFLSQFTGDAVNAGQAAEDHLSARLISIIPPESKLGVLTHIPRKFSNSGKFVDAMREAATNYHGAPFRAFIERLVNERQTNQERLVRNIRGSIAQFMDAAKITGDDPLEYRRALPFGAVYAASRLARRWGGRLAEEGRRGRLSERIQEGVVMDAYLDAAATET